MMQYSFWNKRKKKKRNKILIGNLLLPSPEQTKKNSIDKTSKYWEHYFRNLIYKVLKLKENTCIFIWVS